MRYNKNMEENIKEEKIDVIMFNMSAYSEWQQGYVNRNSHILHEFLRDPRIRKIVAVDYLPFTFKRALKVWLQDVLHWPRGKKMSGRLFSRLTAVANSEINKTVYKVGGFDNEVSYKLFVYSTALSCFSESLAMKDLAQALQKLNLKNIVVWSYLPIFGKCLEVVPSRLKVFDAVDNWLNHSAYQKILPRLKKNYAAIGQTADLIFTTSQDMVDFFEHRPDCYYLPNGIRWHHFKDLPKLVGRDIATLPKPVIGYVGIIQQDRIDLDLIAYLAETNPKKSFAFVGPVWPNFKKRVKEKLGQLNNVYWLGRKHYWEVPAYISKFDVAIVPHLVNEFGKHTSLLKVLEYLACGKPVVSTPTAGTGAFKTVIKLADTPVKFNQALLDALESNTERDQERRRHTAAQHTWAKRAQFMLDKVFAKLTNANE